MSITNQMIQPITEKKYITVDNSSFTDDKNDLLFFETIILKKFESRLLDLSLLSLKKINDLSDQIKTFNKYMIFTKSINEKATKKSKNKSEEIITRLKEIKKDLKTKKINCIIENNVPLLSEKIHLWLENYILFGYPKNYKYEYEKDISKTDNLSIQNTIIDLLEKISLFPTETQVDALELSQQTPYHLIKIAKIFAKTAPDKRKILKSILKEHPSILRLKTRNFFLIEGLMKCYNHLTKIQTKKDPKKYAKDILKDLIKIKGAKNVGLFGDKIDKLPSESTAFFLSVFIENQGHNFCYFCDYPLNVIYESLTSHQFLGFYFKRAYRFTSPLFYKCLIEEPKKIVLLLNKYPEVSNELLQQLIDELMSSEEKYIKFINTEYPLTFINELHEKLKKTPEMLPLILNYIDQQQEIDKFRIMQDIWNFIHLYQVIDIQDVSLIIQNIERLKPLSRELIEKREYWALRKLVKLNGNKQENFIEYLLNNTCKKVDIINQKTYFSRKSFFHQEIKESIQKYILNGIGDDDVEIFCIRIANYIMPFQKCIDFEKIKNIISYSKFNSLSISPTIKNEIISILKILRSNRRICTQIIEFQQLPERESPMGRLLREMTGKDNPSLHDMQLTILSALLCPSRQENVNSCFSTSIIIQQKQYPEGIEQTLLDFIQMFKTNHLSFPIKNKKSELSEPVSYPVLVNSLIYHHSKEHLLNRAREFTLASFGNNIIQEEHPIFNEFITFLLKIDINEIYYKKSISLFKLELENNIEWVYISSKKDPSSKGFGAWNLRNKITNKMISSFDGWAELFNDLAIKVENQLKLEFPSKEENISFLFNGPNGICRKIKSQDFFSKFIKNSRHSTNLNSPWTKFDGGSTERLLESYFNSPDTEMTYKISEKREHRFFKLIIDYLINLPPPIKKRVEKYPEFRIPMDCSFNSLDNIEGHALSLKPTEALTLLDECKTKKNILNKIKLLSNEFSCKKVDERIIKIIINNMNAKLVKKNLFDPLSYLLSIPELYEAESIRNLWNIIIENSIKIGVELSNSLQLLMIKEIYHYSLLQESPKIIIGDTNYKTLSEFILLPDPRRKGSWIPAYTTPIFDKIRFPDITAIHFHKAMYRDRFNLMS